MDPYRKLLVHGINELLARGLINLDTSGDAAREERGHIEATIAGEKAMIIWAGIGFDELRVSVWWKYDHSQHPQANLSGNSREMFMTSRPLAKRNHYPKFIGACASGWLERRSAKYLQGKGNRGLFDTYVRRGEREVLQSLPPPVPAGYAAEGTFIP